MGVDNPIGSGGVGGSPASNVNPQSYTWAAKPAAAAGNNGQIIRITDVGQGETGTGGGTFFQSNGSRWKPITLKCTLDRVDSANAGTNVASTVQQLAVNRVFLPAGLIRDGDVIEIDLGMSKSGTTDNCTTTMHIGAAGTTADTVIATDTTMAGASQSSGTKHMFKRINATTLQRQGNSNIANSFGGSATGVYPTTVTVPNLDTTPVAISIGAAMTTGGSDAPTLQHLEVRLSCSDKA